MIQEKTVQQLRATILNALVVIFLLLALCLMSIVFFEQKKQLDNYKNTTHEFILKTVNHIFQTETNQYTILLDRIIKSLDIGEYVHNNDREGLYKVLKPKFEDFKMEHDNFQTLHFIKADGTSFLRVHKKEHFGDSIINIRPMVQEMMQVKKTLYGHETGIYATVFRIMSPVFYKGEFVGSLGIGIDPNYFYTHIAQIIKHKGGLFIRKDELKTFANHESYSLNISNFRLQTKLDDETFKILKNLPSDYNFEDKYIFNYKTNNYLLHSVDIKNFKGEVNGKFIFLQETTNEIKELRTTQFLIALVIFFFLILAFISIRYFILKFGMNLDRFYEKTISKIQAHENYLKAVEDNSSNIIITSSLQIKLIDANRRFFEFTGFHSIEDFRKKYECICDLFIKKEGYLEKEISGVNWIEYILKNPNKVHKAILKKGNKEKIFKVTSSKILLDNKEVLVSTFSDITKIEEIKNRLSFAINGTKDGLWDWDIQTNEVYFSPRWKEMLGYEPNEIENSLKTWEERVHPDDYNKAVADITANQNKRTETYENIHRLKHKNGHWVWILDRGQTIFDENGKAIRMVGFHTDITKQKEEEKLIKLQAKRAEALLELPKYSEKLEEREFVQKGQEFAKNLTNSQIAFIHFINDNEKTIELVAWSKKTLEHYCKGHLQRFISVPVIENDKVVMITGVGNKPEEYDDLDVETVQLISNDIWRTVQRRRNIEELKQKDKMMLTQSRNAAMGEMISMIAHQWRQPLAVISMSANNILADIELDMLEEETLKEGSKEIIYQTKELSKTIDDFKEFFKPIKKSEEVLIKDIFNDAFKIISKSLENNNIAVIENINNTKKVQTYSRELMQVFINILNNAKEALIEQKTKQKQIKIEIKDKEDFVFIKISDNGGGIKEHIIDKIFEPYFSTKEERNGTGLGLYMSKIIIEKHLGGILTAYNEENGACFTVELPYVLLKTSIEEDTNE